MQQSIHHDFTPRLKLVENHRAPLISAYTVASCIYFGCSTTKHSVHYTLGVYAVCVTRVTVSVICKPIFVHSPYMKMNRCCMHYEVPNRHSVYKEKNTYDYAFLHCKIRCPRQLQKAFFAPFSLNGGRSCHTDFLQLDSAVLWVKNPCNDGLVQLYSPYDTGRIRYPAKTVVSAHETWCRSHDHFIHTMRTRLSHISTVYTAAN